MRAVAVILFATALALGCIAAALYGLDDTRFLTPPPEAVAEEFARQVVAGRYDLLAPMLSRATRERQTRARLEAPVESIREAVGALDNVETEPGSITGIRAHARAVARGKKGSVALDFLLVREHGLWMVDAWRLEPPPSEVK